MTGDKPFIYVEGIDMEYQSYQDLFSQKFKRCKSKKDYKKLCKEMIHQFEVIDQVEQNQSRIFSSMLGSDTYVKGMALAIKMYMLEQQGISCDVISIEDIIEHFE